MVAAAETQLLAQGVEFTGDDMSVYLVDGREVVIPSVWFLRLANTAVKQLERCEMKSLPGFDPGIKGGRECIRGKWSQWP